LALFGSVAGGGLTPLALLACAAFVAAYINAASVNDYADRHIDAINLAGAADRPLISRHISPARLGVLHVISGLVALGLSAALGPVALLATAMMLAFGYAYSLRPVRLSDRGAASQLALGVAYVFYPFTLGYLATGHLTGYPWALTAALYLGFVGRLFLKDFRDVTGDRAHGKRTFIVRHGAAATCAVAAILSTASLGLFLQVSHGAPALALVLIPGQIVVLLALYRLSLLDRTSDQVATVKVLARLGNLAVLAIVAYWVSRDQPQVAAWAMSLAPVGVGAILIAYTDLPPAPARSEGHAVLAS
jgi:4-hydroxybenzoate polyprenyltransferase